MKIKLFLRTLFLILGLLLTGLQSYGQEVSALTYNIKYDNTGDTINNWNDRKEDMVKLLKFYDAGIIGMQEVLYGQLVYLDESLPQFKSIGIGREDGKRKGEFSPILYNTSKFKLLKNETFWLSETPETVSVGWDAALERICTYGLFEDIISGKQFWVFNTHFDHIGETARKKSVELIITKMAQINTEGFPVILMGDLNLTPDQAPIQYLQKKLTDGKVATTKSFYGPSGTYNGFDPDRFLDRRIDYIFVDGFKISSYQHIDDRMENNKHISDHLPVLAQLLME